MKRGSLFLSLQRPGVSWSICVLFLAAVVLARAQTGGSQGNGGRPGPDLPIGEFSVKKVRFNSSHQLLTNITSSFAAEGGSSYSFTGWEINASGQSVANPVSYSKGLAVPLTVTHMVIPAGYEYTLSYYPGNLAFVKRDLTSAGSTWVDTQITSSNTLFSKVYSFPYASPWYCNRDPPIGNQTFDGMGSNKIYVTWATPFGSEVTLKRLDWAVSGASGATSEELLADKIHDAIGENPNGTVDPPYEDFEKPYEAGATWKLLDGNVGGQCDEQALLMKRIVEILGVSGEFHLIRASSDTSVEDLEFDDNIVPGRRAWLVMDFNTGAGYLWNAFEGCCKTANKWYAVYPKVKADTALALYRALSFQQYWVLTVNDVQPGSENPAWQVESVIAEEPKQ